MEKLKKEYVPLGMAVFLVIGALLVGGLFIRKNGTLAGNSGGGSGLALIANAYGAQSSRSINDVSLATLNNQDDSLLSSPSSDGGTGNYVAQEESATFNTGEGIVNDPGGAFADSTSQSGIVSYVVKPGDTLPSIAAYFDVTVDTITGANPSIKGNKVKTGQVLKILPVSGFIYQTQAGDTLTSIASSFNVLPDQIVQANPSAGLDADSDLSFLNAGVSLIIPSSGPSANSSPASGN